ncbi:MAG: hypothetical protein K0M64_14070 [Rhizobium sp.]|nr:hypothetical protein [Rhizobium sp.]
MPGPLMNGFRRVATAILIALLCGCVTTDRQGRTVIHQFGYVRTVIGDSHPSDGPGDIGTIGVTQATTLGLWAGDGVGIGLRQYVLTHPPNDCQVVVHVRNNRQLAHLAMLMNKDGPLGVSVCATSLHLLSY